MKTVKPFKKISALFLAAAMVASMAITSSAAAVSQNSLYNEILNSIGNYLLPQSIIETTILNYTTSDMFINHYTKDSVSALEMVKTALSIEERILRESRMKAVSPDGRIAYCMVDSTSSFQLLYFWRNDRYNWSLPCCRGI